MKTNEYSRKKSPVIQPSKCLDLNIKLLVYLGLWPWNNDNSDTISHIRYYLPRFCLCSASTLAIFQFIDFTDGEGKMAHLTENIYVTLIIVMTIIRVSTILFKDKDVIKLVRTLEDLSSVENLFDEDMVNIYEKYQRYAQLLTKGFFGMCLVTGLNYSISPLTKHEDYPLPHRSYFPYDYTLRPYYELSYAWLAVESMLAGIMIGSCDTFFVSLMINATGQYKLLHHKLEHIREYAAKRMEYKFAVKRFERNMGGGLSDMPPEQLDNLRLLKSLSQEGAGKSRMENSKIDVENFGDTLPKQRQNMKTKMNGANMKKTVVGERAPKLVEDFLVLNEDAFNVEMDLLVGNCVRQHQLLLKFTKKLESVFEVVLVYQIAASLALFCLVAFQTTKSSHIDAQFIALLQVLASAITQLFLYCWFSSELTFESSEVNEAIYKCDWITASPGFKRSMQIILLRTTQPIQITAAECFPVSLELFRQILKTSYSFYTLLDQLDAPGHTHHGQA